MNFATRRGSSCSASGGTDTRGNSNRTVAQTLDIIYWILHHLRRLTMTKNPPTTGRRMVVGFVWTGQWTTGRSTDASRWHHNWASWLGYDGEWEREREKVWHLNLSVWSLDGGWMVRVLTLDEAPEMSLFVVAHFRLCQLHKEWKTSARKKCVGCSRVRKRERMRQNNSGRKRIVMVRLRGNYYESSFASSCFSPRNAVCAVLSAIEKRPYRPKRGMRRMRIRSVLLKSEYCF